MTKEQAEFKKTKVFNDLNGSIRVKDRVFYEVSNVEVIGVGDDYDVYCDVKMIQHPNPDLLTFKEKVDIVLSQYKLVDSKF